MLHPVGSQPAAIYWRRRLVLVVGVVVLLGLTFYVLRPSGGSSSGATGSSTGSPSGSPSSAGRPSTVGSSTVGSSTSLPTTPGTTSGTAAARTTPGSTSAANSSAQPVACVASALSVAALTTAPTFKVGSAPTLYLQVTNTGKVACIQDLADSQIELRVYNGESRVWGSHDCQVQPGVTLRTLAVNSPVRIGVQWSGFSSQPQCAGTRQRVGAGSYTLYALLAGNQGAAAKFVLS